MSKQIEALRHVRHEIAAIEAQLIAAEERDRIQTLRPDGCTCLGTGLVPYWSTVDTSNRYCDCEEGQALRAKDAAERSLQEAIARPARVAELVERIRLPDFVKRLNLSLETFEPIPTQRVVYQRLLAAAGGEKAQSIILHGPASSGKTGLLATLLLRWVERFARPGRYWPATDLMDEITRQAHQPIGDEGDVLWSAGRIPFLMIDDIDKLRLSTSFSVERFYKLINTRYDSGLVTLVTTNMNIEQLTEKLDAYIVDRLIYLCGGMASGWVMEMPAGNRRI